MNTSIYEISILDLLWTFIPVSIVIFIYTKWVKDTGTIIYAMTRMFLQLIMIGYALTFIFNSQNALFISLILSVMLIAASIISLRPLKNKEKNLYFYTFTAISIGGVFTLFIVTQGVIGLTPWFEPRFLIPLAGMIFANSMNAVSLAAERFESEKERGNNYTIARSNAFKAALIPIINSLFAVGLVSLPGMMTGQILSGISPLIAARYQIMVMCMILGSAGISAAIYLLLIKKSKV